MSSEERLTLSDILGISFIVYEVFSKTVSLALKFKVKVINAITFQLSVNFL